MIRHVFADNLISV